MGTEKRIIEGIRSGDENAYKYVYDYHYRVLCILANEYVHDSSTAEMIVSDVIFALWSNRENILISQSLRSYLAKAVRNRCLNYLHVQARLTNIDQTSPVEVVEEYTHPLSRLIEKELDTLINQSIEALPPLTRTIFRLSRFENLKYEEIAQKTNVSIDVVKYHIKSALSHLRKRLKDYLICIFLFFSI